MKMRNKIVAPTPFESNQSVGFRIGPNGEVEVMSEAETDAVVKRAIREAIYSAGWPRLGRTLH